MTLTPELQRLVDCEEIRSVLHRYCLAVDSGDLDLLKGVYWPDATDNHGFFCGNAHEFATFNVAGAARLFDLMQHSISNAVCEVTGDVAHVRSYLIAYHRLKGNAEAIGRVLGPSYLARQGAKMAGPQDYLVGGQYFDTFERREGRWRIRHRIATADWHMVQPSAAAPGEMAFRFATADVLERWPAG